MTGEKLPEGFNIKVIENDPAYNATFVLPDLVSGEIEEDNLEEAGGVSLVVLGSACAAAILGTMCGAMPVRQNLMLNKAKRCRMKTGLSRTKAEDMGIL